MRRLQALLMSLLLALTAACSSQQPQPASLAASPASQTQSSQAAVTDSRQQPDSLTVKLDGQKWINSSLDGTVTADTPTDVKDDFHVAVNKNWICDVEATHETRVTSATERNEQVREQLKLLMNDESLNSHDAQLVKRYYNDYIDMDTRNALGMQPIMPIVEQIKSISTIGELSDYLANDEYAFADFLMARMVQTDFNDSSNNSVVIAMPGYPRVNIASLSGDGSGAPQDIRRQQAYANLAVGLLQRVGYTQQQAQSLNEASYELEKKMVQAYIDDMEYAYENSDYTPYNPVSIQELEALSPSFPAARLLKPFADAGVQRFILSNKIWLEGMNKLYTDENLEAFKAFMLINVLGTFAGHLDQQCMDLRSAFVDETDGAHTESSLENDALENINAQAGVPSARVVVNSLEGNGAPLNMALGRMYAEKIVTPEIKADVEQIVHDVVSVYRARMQNNTWLTEQTKLQAIEKLDNFRIRVAYPDDWSAYGCESLSFPDGGGVAADKLEMLKWVFKNSVSNSTKKTDRDRWIVTPQTVNAFYSAQDNSINIPAGILGGVFYDASASDEQQLGSIGMMIAHEVTHAFDPTGSQYDKDGNRSNWWTDEDHQVFEERIDKVEQYFSTFEILEGKFVNGTVIIGEAVADLGAISCTMEIAHSEKDFDYDTFFYSYAQLWRDQMSLGTIERLESNPHPLGYLRTNINVQQAQEFYDTYGVREGDNMYLALEDRLAVW